MKGAAGRFVSMRKFGTKRVCVLHWQVNNGRHPTQVCGM